MRLYHGSNVAVERGDARMNKLPYFATDYYDREVIGRIVDKYGLSPMEATRSFLLSETHGMLEDADLGLWYFPAFSVFEMWEAERITGDPRNAACIRGE